MQLAMSQEARLEQTLSPRMIQFYQMLQCPLQDLDQLISLELAENPALELIEHPLSDVSEDDARPQSSLGTLPLGDGPPLFDEGDDPVAALPAPVTLQDHLRWHFMALAQNAQEQRIGLRLIEDINPDGYFESSIGEVALILGVSVIEVERVLGLVQRLDPPGVGSRDLWECLRLQLDHLAEQGRDHTVARRIVEECWEPFCRRQFAICARRLKTSEAAVADAAEFLRRNCQPYPGREFRVPWQSSPTAPRAWPEVYLRPNDDDAPPFLAEVIESRRLSLRIDRIYRQLYDEIQGGHETSVDDTEHIQTCVRRAQQFIKSLEQRRETVRRIAQEVADEQAEYLRHGAAQLKPLTRLEIARQLGIHESTVGRAVAGKYVQLPSEEVVLFERFFESAAPVKLALEQLLAAENPLRPLSDQALADQLLSQGFDVARRTVAKYRTELKIPSASRRRRQ